MLNILEKIASAEGTMADSFEGLVNKLYKRTGSEEYKSACALYRFCVTEFPDSLALNLLEVYRTSPSPVFRFRSIYLLSNTLRRDYKFSLVTLNEIKPLLISCLEMQETQEAEVKLFRRITFCIAFNVVILDNDGWKELSECILFLSSSDPLKAFNIFLDLPIFQDDNFISRFKDTIQEQAFKMLLNPEEDGIQDWSLALQTAVKMGIQLLKTEFRNDLTDEILSNLVKVASELVEKGTEIFLLQGLENLESFLYKYNSNQSSFVKAFFIKIKAVGKIIRSFEGSYNPTIQQQDHGADGHLWYAHMKSLSPFDLLEIVAASDLYEMYREFALISLKGLLSDHNEKVKTDISVMRQLQPVLISCIKEEGMHDSMFKTLCQVVIHVVKFEDGKWDGLRDYFASESKRDFCRAVNVFNCLKMLLEDEGLIHFAELLRPSGLRVETAQVPQLPVDLIAEIVFKLPLVEVVRLSSLSKIWEGFLEHHNLLRTFLGHHGLLLTFVKGPTRFFMSSLQPEQPELAAPACHHSLTRFFSLDKISRSIQGLICGCGSDGTKIKICNPFTGRAWDLPPQQNGDMALIMLGYEPTSQQHKLYS